MSEEKNKETKQETIWIGIVLAMLLLFQCANDGDEPQAYNADTSLSSVEVKARARTEKLKQLCRGLAEEYKNAFSKISKISEKPLSVIDFEVEEIICSIYIKNETNSPIRYGGRMYFKNERGINISEKSIYTILPIEAYQTYNDKIVISGDIIEKTANIKLANDSLTIEWY